MGSETLRADYRSDADLAVAMRALVAKRVQAVFVYGSNTSLGPQLPNIVQFFAAHRLPDMYIARQAVALGSLMSYGVDLIDMRARSADYADKTLRGAKPADLPVQLPTKYDMAVNLKTAKALGLKLPLSIPTRADQLIE